MLRLGEGVNRLTSVVDEVTSDLGTMLRGLAQGDLSRRIERDYQGRFGDLKQDANDTAEQLIGIVGQIQSATCEIENAASEISSGTEDLSQRTEQAASNVEETAASTEEMAATVKQNADNAKTPASLPATPIKVRKTGVRSLGRRSPL